MYFFYRCFLMWLQKISHLKMSTIMFQMVGFTFFSFCWKLQFEIDFSWNLDVWHFGLYYTRSCRIVWSMCWQDSEWSIETSYTLQFVLITGWNIHLIVKSPLLGCNSTSFMNHYMLKRFFTIKNSTLLYGFLLHWLQYF